jgi:hypothetical protein
MASNSAAELAHEQAYVTALYERLDALRALTGQRLAAVRLGPTAENHQRNSRRRRRAGTGKTVVALHRAAYLQTPATSRAGLTPQRLLAQLYAEPGRLDLTDDERAAVARRTQAPWTPADVPLLDELAELLGPLDATTRTASRRRAADEAERAQTRKYTAQLVKQLAEEQAKGLEFDSVIIVDPAGIERASSRGRADLYVALTRTTRRLGLVLSDDWQAPGTPAAHR